MECQGQCLPEPASNILKSPIIPVYLIRRDIPYSIYHIRRTVPEEDGGRRRVGICLQENRMLWAAPPSRPGLRLRTAPAASMYAQRGFQSGMPGICIYTRLAGLQLWLGNNEPIEPFEHTYMFQLLHYLAAQDRHQTLICAFGDKSYLVGVGESWV